jgi:hypothetical protein
VPLDALEGFSLFCLLFLSRLGRELLTYLLDDLF